MGRKLGGGGRLPGVGVGCGGAAGGRGLTPLVPPVGPKGKHGYRALPMARYITMVREDGLPADPWLRVHVRAGGKIRQVAPASMVMAGSLSQWRGGAGLPPAPARGACWRPGRRPPRTETHTAPALCIER